MAHTQNGIYYQDDYSKEADILKDMKEMAESVDTEMDLKQPKESGKGLSENDFTDAYKDKLDGIESEANKTTVDTELNSTSTNPVQNKVINAEIQSLQSELIQTKKDLNNSTLTISGQGEDITLNNTVEASFKKAPLPEGNSKQETTTGKNKFKPLATEEKKGIRLTNNEDGSYTLNGTSTGATSFYITGLNYAAGTYSLSANNEAINSNSAFYLQAEVSGESIRTSFNNVNATITKTISNPITALSIVIPSGLSVSNFVIKPQLEQGSQATSFEPYTGGASPNPNYEQPIYSVGDDINEFDKDNANVINSYFSNTSNIISSTSNSYKSVYINCKPNITYTISKIESARFSLGYTTEIPSVGVSVQGVITDNVAKNITITTGENALYLIAFVYHASYDTDITAQEIIDSIKIAKGSKATPYSPYGMGTITEKIYNKNLFDKDKALLNKALNRINNNLFDLEGYTTSDYCKVKPETTYYLGIQFSSSNYGIVFYDQNKNYISGRTAINSFSTPVNCEYLRFTFKNENYDINTIQLEEGSTATPYTKHQEQTYTIPTQQPMRSIGNVRDGFVKVNGSWVERHYISRKVFDGSETIGKSGNTSADIFSYLISGDTASGTSETKCNYLLYANTNVVGSCRKFNNFIYLIPYSYGTATIEQFKETLTSLYQNNVPYIVDYLLATPLDLPCTEEQIAILNEIEKYSESYQDVTHIFSNDEVSPYFEVEARGDINSLLTRIEVLESEV